MSRMMKKLRALPPVKAVRALRWRRRAYKGMVPGWIIAPAECVPGIKRAALRLWGRKTQMQDTTMDLSPETVADMAWWRVAYGFSPAEYRCYGFAEKSREERLAYFSDRESVRLSYLLNDLDAMAVFTDKWETYRRFGNYFGREVIRVTERSDPAGLSGFLRRHPAVMAKPLRGSCGKGIRWIGTGETVAVPELLRELTKDGPVVLEEAISQSAVPGAFHPASVNTVRIVTLDGELLDWSFLKTGVGGAATDNGASGGVMAGIDLHSGRVVTPGIDETGAVYARHPDTGVPFADALLPEWDALIRLCRTLAVAEPRVRLIGWDLAHTDGGWVLVEGNAQPEMIGPQAVSGKGLRAAVMEILRERGLPTAAFRG